VQATQWGPACRRRNPEGAFVRRAERFATRLAVAPAGAGTSGGMLGRNRVDVIFRLREKS